MPVEVVVQEDKLGSVSSVSPHVPRIACFFHSRRCFLGQSRALEIRRFVGHLGLVGGPSHLLGANVLVPSQLALVLALLPGVDLEEPVQFVLFYDVDLTSGLPVDHPPARQVRWDGSLERELGKRPLVAEGVSLVGPGPVEGRQSDARAVLVVGGWENLHGEDLASIALAGRRLRSRPVRARSWAVGRGFREFVLQGTVLDQVDRGGARRGNGDERRIVLELVSGTGFLSLSRDLGSTNMLLLENLDVSVPLQSTEDRVALRQADWRGLDPDVD